MHIDADGQYDPEEIPKFIQPILIPKPNIKLVNNAGIQRMVDFKKGIYNLSEGENEIEINLTAPIHLSVYFIPDLLRSVE